MAKEGYFKIFFDHMKKMEVLNQDEDTVIIGENSDPSLQSTPSPVKIKKRLKLTQTRILGRLSWLIALMAFHIEDLAKVLIDNKIVNLLEKLINNDYQADIKANAMLSVSLLTYNSDLFDIMIKAGFVDTILKLSKDTQQETNVRQYSTLALVHFALDKKSINLLIEKGIMDLFQSFSNKQLDTS